MRVFEDDLGTGFDLKLTLLSYLTYVMPKCAYCPDRTYALITSNLDPELKICAKCYYGRPGAPMWRALQGAVDRA